MMIGRLLGNRFEILEQLGGGGMAIVYKGRDTFLNRLVTIKILRIELTCDEDFVKRFRMEAKSIASLSHPNIVSIHDVGWEGEIQYLVMEYVEGDNLKSLIRGQGALVPERVVQIARQICEALQHAHENNIVHRDIKPQNILITTGGQAKLTDFGIAREATAATVTQTDTIVGSVHYISPEQARGETADPRSDIYSLGIVLYEMITGTLPFQGETPIGVALKHIQEEPPKPFSLKPGVPTVLEKIIAKSVSKIPADRYETARDMAADLEKIFGAITGELGSSVLPVDEFATRVLPPMNPAEQCIQIVSREKTTGKKRPGWIWAVMIILFLLIFGAAAFYFYMDVPVVQVPSVEGKPLEEARGIIQKKGIRNIQEIRETHPTVPQGTVISQDPDNGRKVKEGREIKVIISKGGELTEVPNIRGIDISDAKSQLEDAGLTLGTQEQIYDDKYDEGVVISQDPSPNDKVKSGSKVNVTVSKGKQPDKIQMPDLLGVSLDEAKKVLENNKLELGGVNQAESSKYYSGQVSSQDIAAGVMVDEESKVNLVVSTGPGPTAQTSNLQFTLPTDQEYYKVLIRVKDAKGQREVYNEIHRGGDTVFVGVNYYGSGTAEIFLNGQSYKTVTL
jgi:serine/threonine-protein kinase